MTHPSLHPSRHLSDQLVLPCLRSARLPTSEEQTLSLVPCPGPMPGLASSFVMVPILSFVSSCFPPQPAGSVGPAVTFSDHTGTGTCHPHLRQVWSMFSFPHSSNGYDREILQPTTWLKVLRNTQKDVLSVNTDDNDDMPQRKLESEKPPSEWVTVALSWPCWVSSSSLPGFFRIHCPFPP